MEERYVELIAVGHSIGESISMNILEPEGPVHLETTMDLRLQISYSGAPLELKLGETRGFEPSSDPVIGHETEEQVTYSIKMEPTGAPGPSIVRVVIKGDQYFATLALSEFNVKFHPPRVSISLPGSTIKASPADTVSIPVRMSCGKSQRVKGMLEFSLTSNKGVDPATVFEGSLPVSFRGSYQFRLEIPIKELGVHEGALDLHLLFEDGKLSIDEHLENAILVEGATPGEEEPVPSLARSSSGDLEEPREISLLSASFVPETASPGSSVVFRVEVSRTDLMDAEIKGRLEFGPGREWGFIIPPGAVKTELEVRIPKGMRGPATPVLTLETSEMEPLRTVLHRSFTLKGTGRIEVRKIEHMVMDEGTPTPHSELLYPGEKVVRKRNMGEMEVLDLTTGRHLYLHKGKVVLGPGWDTSRTDEALRLVMALEIRDSILDPDRFRELRKGLEELGRFSRMTMAKKHRSREPEDWDKDLPGIPKGDPGDGLVGTLVKRSLSGSLLDDPRKRAKGETNDPVPILHNHIISLLGLEDTGDGSKDYLEHLVREMRSPTQIDLDHARWVHLGLLSHAKSMLDDITGEGDRSSELVYLLLALVLAHLVRIEIFSSWSDPAVNPWDELRIERQRSLKGEIGSMLDLVASLNRMHRTLLQRIEGYRKNMRTRTEVSRSAKGRISSSTRPPSGDFGDEWRGSIRIDLGKTSAGSLLVPTIMLPGPSWNLVSPASTREGNIYTLEPARCREDGILIIETTVSSPPDPGADPELLLHLSPIDTRLEVEP